MIATFKFPAFVNGVEQIVEETLTVIRIDICVHTKKNRYVIYYNDQGFVLTDEHIVKKLCDEKNQLNLF